MLEEKALKEQVLKNEKYQKFLMDVVEFVQGTSEVRTYSVRGSDLKTLCVL